MKALPKFVSFSLIGAFSLLGPYSIWSTVNRFGPDWISESFKAILNDPIYLYAVADLGAIFSIISYWTYLECKQRKRTFWPWPISFFNFGTPAFLIFLLTHKRQQSL